MSGEPPRHDIDFYVTSAPLFPRPDKRVRDYLRLLRQLIGETRNLAYGTRATLADQAVEIAQIRAENAQLAEIMRLTYDRVLWRRERLRALRTQAAYERAYAEPEPLVSVVIPTYDKHELLRERAIPSVLSQTYQNFEIVVVGDSAPEEARTATESFGDPRIRFFNLDYRGPYPKAPEKLWLVGGTQPFNEAVRRASGLWIAPLDDDDAFRPSHIERLLTHARDQQLELAYGRICAHLPDGGTTVIGSFPPELGQFGYQATIYHAGLAEMFELEVVDAQLETPNDWGWCRRLMEAGVRMGMLSDEFMDYYPSRLWPPSPETEPGGDAPEWEYVPEGWSGDRGAPSRGWGADEVAHSYAAKWPRFLAAVEGTGPLGVGHEVQVGASMSRDSVLDQNAVLAFAYAITRAAGGTTALSVLDWGGALGHYYVLARRMFPDFELQYHCRELPAVCAEGRRVLPEVTFHETDECLDRRYDLVLASNSLQYEEDWRARLRQLANATGRRLFVTRVPVARHAGSFVTLQRAHAYGYATEYLGWVLNRDELCAAAGDAGLALEREFLLASSAAIAGAPEGPSQAGFLFEPAKAAPTQRPGEEQP